MCAENVQILFPLNDTCANNVHICLFINQSAGYIGPFLEHSCEFVWTGKIFFTFVRFMLLYLFSLIAYYFVYLMSQTLSVFGQVLYLNIA